MRGAGYLSVESDGAGLALGADALWPGRMTLTARFNLTADIFKCHKLPPDRQENFIKSLFLQSYSGKSGEFLKALTCLLHP